MDPIAKLIRNPLLLLGPRGEVLEMNRRAEQAFGGDRERWGQVFTDPEQLRALLRQASGTSDPEIGAAELTMAEGARRRHRLSVLALRAPGGPAFAVEVKLTDEDQFGALTDKIRELNSEIGVRRRAQAELEESLAHNRILYRELQHRVKNQLQMMLALVSAAGRESPDPAHKQFVATLQAKLSALFDAQRLMYADQTAEGVRADQMLNAIAETVQALSGASTVVEVRAEALVVPNDIAFPIALIANELLTNAAKYGGRGAESRVAASLRRSDQDAVLEIRDNGPGFTATPPTRAASGLGLVQGLCRQIGGRLDITSDNGAVATVSFRLPEAAHVAS